MTFEGGYCFGLPVVEAQVLEALTEPGTIRCAEMVKLLARGRGGHEFVSLGALELKGLAEPLPACEVRWAPLDEEVTSANVELGLPPVFAHAGGLPFCGRAEVFDQLADAWTRRVAGGADLAPSAQRPKTDAADRLEMLPIAGDDREPVLDRRRRDQCVGKPDSELTGDTSTTLGDSTIHGNLAERGEEPNGQVGSGVAGDELRPRDHGVVHTMASWPQLNFAAKMVDEDIGIDEDVSHDASRHEKERTRPAQRRRCSSEHSWGRPLHRGTRRPLCARARPS